MIVLFIFSDEGSYVVWFPCKPISVLVKAVSVTYIFHALRVRVIFAAVWVAQSLVCIALCAVLII
jgi:hypothetical protein